MARTVAMFVDQSDTAEIEAGVSAYVVDGFKKERIKPVLEPAIHRFIPLGACDLNLAPRAGRS